MNKGPFDFLNPAVITENAVSLVKGLVSEVPQVMGAEIVVANTTPAASISSVVFGPEIPAELMQKSEIMNVSLSQPVSISIPQVEPALRTIPGSTNIHAITEVENQNDHNATMSLTKAAMNAVVDNPKTSGFAAALAAVALGGAYLWNRDPKINPKTVFANTYAILSKRAEVLAALKTLSARKDAASIEMLNTLAKANVFADRPAQELTNFAQYNSEEKVAYLQGLKPAVAATVDSTLLETSFGDVVKALNPARIAELGVGAVTTAVSNATAVTASKAAAAAGVSVSPETITAVISAAGASTTLSPEAIAAAQQAAVAAAKPAAATAKKVTVEATAAKPKPAAPIARESKPAAVTVEATAAKPAAPTATESKPAAVTVEATAAKPKPAAPIARESKPAAVTVEAIAAKPAASESKPAAPSRFNPSWISDRLFGSKPAAPAPASKPAVDTAAAKPAAPAVEATASKPAAVTVEATASKPAAPAVDAAAAKPAAPAVEATASKPAAPAVEATAAKPAAVTVEATAAKPAAPAVDTTAAKPAAPAVEATAAKPAAPAAVDAAATNPAPVLLNTPAAKAAAGKPAAAGTAPSAASAFNRAVLDQIDSITDAGKKALAQKHAGELRLNDDIMKHLNGNPVQAATLLAQPEAFITGFQKAAVGAQKIKLKNMKDVEMTGEAKAKSAAHP